MPRGGSPKGIRPGVFSRSGARLRIHARSALLLAGVACAQLACASSGPGPPEPLKRLWREYLELPEQRALVIAGDPETSRWVAGASGGQASAEDAEQAALAECRRRRVLRRMRAPCLPYAVGDEIVWKAR